VSGWGRERFSGGGGKRRGKGRLREGREGRGKSFIKRQAEIMDN
jgi:hypothetical protein